GIQSRHGKLGKRQSVSRPAPRGRHSTAFLQEFGRAGACELGCLRLRPEPVGPLLVAGPLPVKQGSVPYVLSPPDNFSTFLDDLSGWPAWQTTRRGAGMHACAPERLTAGEA